jgi:membrane protein YdbS with pleckstrin-like domain
VVDDMGRERKMDCDIDLFSDLGHVLLWFVISILTLGIGYIFYFYRVWNYALNNTRID